MDTKTTTKKKLSLLPLFWKGLGGSLLLLALTGCPGESPIDSPDDPSNPGVKVEYVMQNTNLQGTVKDATGSPLGGVKVTTGTLSATTGSDGKFTFDKAGTLNDRAVIKFEKSGYFTQTRSGDKANEMYIEAMLYRKGNDSISLQTDFDAAKEKTLQLRGITVNLPAGCMAKADGSAYSGTVRADVLYLTPVNETASRLMPGGDLMCITADKSEKMLMPFGMVDVTFTDNSGNPLEIKKNSEVKISFPVPAGATAANLPATLPLWTFDEAKGVWIEEGVLTHQSNVYTGTVSHFTKRAGGEFFNYSKFTVHASACNKAAAGAQITVFYEYKGNGDDVLVPLHPIMPYITDSNGDCSCLAPSGKSWFIDIYGTYKGQEQSTRVAADYAAGYRTVVLEFNGECEGYDLTFDLIPKGKNSFSIKCTPAMPEPKVGTKRQGPHTFLGGAGESPFIMTKTGGDPHGSLYLSIGMAEGQGGYWEEGFTKYTYSVEVPGGDPWVGYVAMRALNNLASNKAFLEALNIKSIKIGSNNPVAFSLP